MSARVPDPALSIVAASYARGEAVLAGESSDDEPLGYRGLVSQTNHGYACRVRTIEGRGRPCFGAPIDERVAETANASGEVLWEVPWHLAQDVSTVRLVAIVEDLEVRVSDSAGSSSWSSFTAGRERHEVELVASAAGADEVFQVEGRAIGGGTGYVYLSELEEVRLTSSDFPSSVVAPVEVNEADMAIQEHTRWRVTDTHTVHLDSQGTEQKAYVKVRDAAGNAIMVAIPTAGLDGDVEATGLGGMRTTTGVLGNGAVAEWRVVTKAAGADPMLLGEDSGHELTYAELTAEDSDYTMMSLPLHFSVNDSSGDLLNIRGTGDTWEYVESASATRAAGPLNSTSPVALDLSSLVGATWASVDLRCTFIDTDNRTVYLLQDSGGTLIKDQFGPFDNVAGKIQLTNVHINVRNNGNALATALYVDYDATPTTGGYFDVMGGRIR